METKAPRVEEEEEAAEPSLDQLAPEILIVIAEAAAANDDVLKPWHHEASPARAK